MPIRDLIAAPAGQEQGNEEEAIVRAVDRYFGTAPAGTSAAETSILNALHRYFAKT